MDAGRAPGIRSQPSLLRRQSSGLLYDVLSASASHNGFLFEKSCASALKKCFVKFMQRNTR